MKKLILVITLIALINVCSAQTIKVEINPRTLLPNDIADCKISIETTNAMYIKEIVFFPPHEVEVFPSSITGIGQLMPGSVYELPFTIKVKKSGIYTIPVYIRTLNETLKHYIVVRVESRMPEIVLNKTTLTLNEVNEIEFRVSSPIDISNVIVEPLFEANPSVIFVKDYKGSFKFEPRKPIKLKFKLKFYNGRNFHEIIQEINVSYVHSRGLIVNISSDYSLMRIGDVMTVSLEIINLRSDNIFSLTLNVSSNYPYDVISKNIIKIPIIRSGDKKIVKFKFCPKRAGKRTLTINLKYMDEFNIIHIKNININIKVINKTTLQFSSIEVERKIGAISITGDICNLGKTRVYNIMISAFSDNSEKTYFIEYLDPSDFDSFELSLPSAKLIRLKAKWNNELGEEFEICKDIKIPETKPREESSNILPLIISIIALAVVLMFVILTFKRRT